MSHMRALSPLKLIVYPAPSVSKRHQVSRIRPGCLRSAEADKRWFGCPSGTLAPVPANCVGPICKAEALRLKTEKQMPATAS